MTTTAPPFDPDPTIYVGWLRPTGGPWRRVCRASTWDGCWDLLLRIDPEAATAEKLVNLGKHPEHRRRPR